MEHYIQVIIMLAPGFIAKEVSKWLGYVQLKHTAMEQVLDYFLYSVFTMAPTLWVLYLCGYNTEYLPVNINKCNSVCNNFFIQWLPSRGYMGLVRKAHDSKAN